MRLLVGELTACNVRVNGLRSLLFSFGLGRGEFIEFSCAKALIDAERPAMVLDVGSGHSLMPLLTSRETVVLDLDLGSLRWQKEKAAKVLKRENPVVRASADRLPFRDGVFDVVTAISSLEHMPGQGDRAACVEILRTMKCGGVSMITVPGSRSDTTIEEEGIMVGVPHFAHVFLRPIMKPLFRMFQVDRADTFHERRYSRREGRTRLVPPESREARIRGYAMTEPLRALVSRVYPYSFITVADAFLATRIRLVGDGDPTGFLVISFRK